MYRHFKRFSAWALLACLPLVVAGCGGGGGGGSAAVPMTSISGQAMKGPIKGALVEVFQLRPNGSPGDLIGSSVSGDDGRYTVAVPVSRNIPPLLIRVTGRAGASYISETTGNQVSFSASESFNAVVDTISVNQSVVVSPLTETAYQKLQEVLTANPALVADVKTVDATNALVARLFNVSDIMADPATTPANQAALRVIDQMVVDSGANTVPVMNLINQAMVDTAAPAYQTYLAALTTAGNEVVTALSVTNPQQAAAAQALLTTAATPPADPVWTDTTPPTAPANLTATVVTLNATTGQATLVWGASSDDSSIPVSYDVFRDNSRIATVTATGYTDATLLPGSTYVYYVVAFDGVGNRSLPGNSVSVKPNPVNLGIIVDGQLSGGILGLPYKDLVAPTPPTDLSATTTVLTASQRTVRLAWSGAVDNVAIFAYEVFRNGSKIATVTTGSYTDSPVDNATQYSYTIVSLDTSGNRSPASSPILVPAAQISLQITVNGQITSDVTSLPTADITAPSAPSNLSATTTSLTATQSSVNLSWSGAVDNVGVTGYEIFRNGVKVATTTNLTLIDTPVTPNVACSYYVKAFDAAGNRSVAGSTLVVTPPAAALGINVSGQIL